MKKTLFFNIFLFIVCSSISVFSQGSKLIIISEEVGDTIDLRERHHFNLWPSFNGFTSAIVLQDGTQNTLLIYYKISRKTETMQYILSEDEYKQLGTWIDNYDEISRDKSIEPFDIPKRADFLAYKPPTKNPIVEIITIDDLFYQGKLLDIENEEEISIDMDNVNKKIYINSIKTFSYKRERVKGKSIILGAGIGFLASIIVGEFINSISRSFSSRSSRENMYPKNLLIGSGMGLLGGTIVEGIRIRTTKQGYNFQKMYQYEKVKLLKRILGKG